MYSVLWPSSAFTRCKREKLKNGWGSLSPHPVKMVSIQHLIDGFSTRVHVPCKIQSLAWVKRQSMDDSNHQKHKTWVNQRNCISSTKWIKPAACSGRMRAEFNKTECTGMANGQIFGLGHNKEAWNHKNWEKPLATNYFMTNSRLSWLTLRCKSRSRIGFTKTTSSWLAARFPGISDKGLEGPNCPANQQPGSSQYTFDIYFSMYSIICGYFQHETRSWSQGKPQFRNNWHPLFRSQMPCSEHLRISVYIYTYYIYIYIYLCVYVCVCCYYHYCYYCYCCCWPSSLLLLLLILSILLLHYYYYYCHCHCYCYNIVTYFIV